MMLKTLTSKIAKDDDFPDRVHRMEVLNRVLDGKLYDVLVKAFHEEYNERQEYVPLRERRPSVQYNVCRVVVNDAVSMLFSEGHFPNVVFDLDKDGKADDDGKGNEILLRVIKETLLNATMIDAATRGSVGSVAILYRVKDLRPCFEVLKTQYLTPKWSNTPNVLEGCVELYKTSGRELWQSGYDIKKQDRADKYWFKREWTKTEETWYQPLKVSDVKADEDPKFTRDSERSVKHDLDFCPIVWVKNLPGGEGDDGAPTFTDPAIVNSIEIDYLLSQGGRGLKYSSQPTTVVKSDDPSPQKHIAGDALIVPAGGDAKLLETKGNASAAVIEYVKLVRELTLEMLGGNRTDPSKLSAATSGRAMELMNQLTVWLADKMRISYGEYAIPTLLDMLRRSSAKFKIAFNDGTPIKLPEGPFSLKWPDWYPPTSDDRQRDASAIQALKASGAMSTQTAVRAVASVYDVEDVDSEVKLIEAEAAAQQEAQLRVSMAKKADKTNADA